MWNRDCCDRAADRTLESSVPGCFAHFLIALALLPILLGACGARGADEGGDITFTATILVESGLPRAGEASTGGHGAMFADATGDALPDLYVTRNRDRPMTDLFFRNTGGHHLAQEASARGIADPDGGSHGASWCDLDNDGDYDLVNGTTLPGLSSPARTNVFRNNGDGHFTDVTETSGIPLNCEWPTRSVLCLDMDRDGDLDVFAVSGCLGSEDPVPERNEVYTNEGEFQFTPVLAGDLSIAPAGQGAADTDFDGDGDVDVVVANRTGEVNLLQNDGRGDFTLIPPVSLGIRHPAGDGISVGDVDNDGDPDLLLCGGEYGHLYKSDGAGFFSFAQSFTETAGYMGTFADLDNDTDIDLVFAGDSRVYINTGSGEFVIGPVLTTAHLVDPRAIASADIDGDGDVDLAVTAKRSESSIFWNRAHKGHWLKVRLVSPQGQVGAFGARTAVYPAGRLGGRELLGWRESRSNNGYLAQDDPVLHIGLGSHRLVDVAVTFLDGTQVVRTAVTADQTITVDGRLGQKFIADGPGSQLSKLRWECEDARE